MEPKEKMKPGSKGKVQRQHEEVKSQNEAQWSPNEGQDEGKRHVEDQRQNEGKRPKTKDKMKPRSKDRGEKTRRRPKTKDKMKQKSKLTSDGKIAK